MCARVCVCARECIRRELSARYNTHRTREREKKLRQNFQTGTKPCKILLHTWTRTVRDSRMWSPHIHHSMNAHASRVKFSQIFCVFSRSFVCLQYTRSDVSNFFATVSNVLEPTAPPLQPSPFFLLLLLLLQPISDWSWKLLPRRRKSLQILSGGKKDTRLERSGGPWAQRHKYHRNERDASFGIARTCGPGQNHNWLACVVDWPITELAQQV